MVHSQLPVLSLLCLCWALMLLPPELTLGRPQKFSLVTPKDAGLQKALAFTVPQYNQKRTNDANYFRLQRVTARSKVYTERLIKYRLKIEVVKTVCEKTTSHTMTYEEIQQCPLFPGQLQNQSCYLKVTSRPVEHNMTMKIVSCI
ncbi:cystatin-like [Crotalus tigris]|uniref:cystatin-like n=1 Tax=Crotalus tigris TaxID=88082 RepID=UPI00192F309E|nr:cystatin-like [Crotalus tigris]